MSILNNEQDSKKIMSFFSSSINSNMKILNNHKKVLTQYILKVIDYPVDDTTKEVVDSIVKFLSDLKENLSLIEEGISILKDFQQKYNCSELSYNIIYEYTNISTKISEDIIKIDNFLIDAINFTILDFHITDKYPIKHKHDINTYEISKDDNIELIENTLIISETKKLVTLPYTIDELKDILKNNSDQYSNLNDVILKNYTIPLQTYKNYSLSRFKEAFNLIMQKEKR